MKAGHIIGALTLAVLANILAILIVNKFSKK